MGRLLTVRRPKGNLVWTPINPDTWSLIRPTNIFEWSQLNPAQPARYPPEMRLNGYSSFGRAWMTSECEFAPLWSAQWMLRGRGTSTQRKRQLSNDEQSSLLLIKLLRQDEHFGELMHDASLRKPG